jgi:eukaryotic-like serine/threonine-protein kinase
MSERSIFITALEKPPGEDRMAYLDAACKGDAELRRRVDELLAPPDDDDAFLARPAIERFLNSEPSDQDADLCGSRIGPYTLLEKIGEGGMGVVYMASQESPVQRRVAVKIIKPGMQSAQVIARFEAERQALALMDHQNIAKVFEAGASENGRPYFVMELVHGIPITEFCDQHQLIIEDRLTLFAQVCRAVQHAHQKGIIHRDVKPSNVLVTMYDGVPVPKIIDFGVAKAIEQRLTERTLFTNFGLLVGTFEYMAPEQAEMSAIGVDTRSDIYSLGVLLYELLTGTTPLERQRFREAAFGDALRIIRDCDPPPPSTRLGNSGDRLSAISNLRKTDPQKLMRRVRGELDWIVMKCLEKDRSRRYETAHGLALDIERYLSDEAVSASPPGVRYLMRKFVRRNKGLLAAASAVAAALLLGLGLSTIAFVDARNERDRAEAARKEADVQRRFAERNEAAAKRQAEKANAVSHFVQDLFTAQEAQSLDVDMTVRQVLDRSAKALEQAPGKHDAETEAAVRNVLGSAYAGLGMFMAAEPQLRIALEIREQTFGPDHLEVAASLNSLGEMYIRKKDLAQAEPPLRRALAIREKELGREHPLVADTLHDLVYVCSYRQNVSEAAAFSERALAIRKKIAGAESRLVATSYYSRAILLEQEGKFPEAEEASRRALVLFQQHDGAESVSVANTLHLLSIMLQHQQKPEAETRLRESITMMRRLRGKDNPEVLGRVNRLVHMLKEKGQLAEAGDIEREQLQIDLSQVERRLTENPKDFRLYLNRADLNEQLGNYAEAARDLKRFLATDPTDHWHWFRCGALFLYVGDHESYRWCVGEMVGRFADNPHSYIGERVAKLCLLDPEGPVDLGLVEQLTDRAVKNTKYPQFFGWHKASKAWAEYRAGRFDEAIEWAARSRRDNTPLIPPCEATALLITSMAQHRLGDGDTARKTLAEAVALLDPPLSKHRTVHLAEMTEHILLAEAQNLIGDSAASVPVAIGRYAD